MASQNAFDIASRLFNVALGEKEKDLTKFLPEAYEHSKCLKQEEYLSNYLIRAAGYGDLEWYLWYFECYSMTVDDPDGEMYPEFGIKLNKRGGK